MSETIEEIRENFNLLHDWEERYRYVIELGHNLAPYPEALRNEAHRIKGCVSQVWLSIEKEAGSTHPHDPILYFKADSDALIVKGLVYLVVTFYSGKRVSEILENPVTIFLESLHLQENLTTQRANGLHALIDHIHRVAHALLPA